MLIWLEIWAQLTLTGSRGGSYFEMIGLDGDIGLRVPVPIGEGLATGHNVDNNGRRILYIPLQFWFCRNIGLSLPLIALQYHEVQLNILFGTESQVLINASIDSGESLGVSVWVDYIYLDTDERRRFAQVSHEYLIEQLQYQSESYDSTTVNIDMTFNHPVKELVWVCRQTTAEAVKQWNNYTTILAANDNTNEYAVRPNILSGDNPATNSAANIATYRRTVACNMVLDAKIQLNGHDRVATMPGSYYNYYQTLQHHTRKPDSPGINVFSFALKPEDHQPSGTCNFSRIDNARLVLTLDSNVANSAGGAVTLGGNILIFAYNYNVLRVMSGMAGLAYSN